MNEAHKKKDELEKELQSLKQELKATRDVLKLEALFDEIDKNIDIDSIDSTAASVLESIRVHFDADRCFLLTPCDQDSDFWSIPFESARKGYESNLDSTKSYPITPELRELIIKIEHAGNAIDYTTETVAPELSKLMRENGVKSKIVKQLRTLSGESWMFGLAQCGTIREWAESEKLALSLIGSKISDWLSLVQAVEERSQFMSSIEYAEELYRGVFENTGSAMVIYGKDGIVQNVNRQFEQLTGYKIAEIRHKLHWKTFVTKKYVDKMLEYHNQRGVEGYAPPETYEFDILHKNGDNIPVSATVRIIEGKDLRIISLVDLRHIYNIQAEKERLISILEATSDMVTIADKNGQIIYLNKAGYDFMGIDDDVLSMNYDPAGFYPDWAHKIIREVGMPVARERGVWTGETAIYNTERQEVAVSQTLCAHRDKNGELDFYSSIARDISDIKKIQGQLNQSLEKYFSLFESVSDSIFILEDGVFVECNQATLDMYALDNKGDILGHSPIEFSPDFQPDGSSSGTSAKSVIKEALEGRPQVFYWKHKTKNDKLFDAEVSLNRFFINDKPHLFAIVRDITEKLKAEQEIIKSEENYRLLAENASDCIWKLDLATETFTYISPGIKQITGFEPKDVLGYNLRKVFPRSDYNRVKEILKLELEKNSTPGVKIDRKVTMEVRHFHREKKYVWTEYTASFSRDKYGKVNEIVGVSREIEERKKAEKSLKESEELFRTVITSSNDAIISINPHGVITIFNNAAEKMFGYKQNEMIGQRLDSLMPEKFRKNHHKNVISYFKTGKPDHAIGNTLELPAMRKTGEVFPIDLTLSVGLVGGNRFVFANIRDISERKQAERDIRESEERFRSLHQASFGGICINANNQILEANQGLSDITGYEYDELIGKNIDALLVKEYRKEYLKKIKKDVEGVFEFIGIREDGETYPVEIRNKRIPYKDSFANITEFRDISSRKEAEAEKRELENQLQQSQKMEAIGRLAGGVAHDFNNLLTAISGNAEIGMLSTDENDPKKVFFEEITSTADRAAELTKRLLAFSRKQKLQPKIVNMNNLITGMGKMLSRIIEENVECTTELDQLLWQVKVDPGQIEQVLLNLAVNARDAMGESGRITISTRNVSVDHQVCLISERPFSGEHVLVSVKDNGIGIEAGKIKKIFEPFYTTKELGRGTGLGLSMVQGIMDQSEGHIVVQSIPGVGTTFNLFFKPVNLDEIVNKEIAETNLNDYRGNETIMVVEDEEVVREMIRKILDSLGYNSIYTESPTEALAVYRELEEKPDAIISDIVMPKMSGTLLIKKMLKIHPEQKYLFISGYFTEGANNDSLVQVGDNFLQKPFKPLDLAISLKKILK